MYTYIILEMISALAGAVAVIVFLEHILRQRPVREFFKKRWAFIPSIVFVIAFFGGMIANKTYAPNFAMPPFMHSHAPGGISAALPFGKVLEFFRNQSHFERVADISADPNAVPPAIERDAPAEVHIDLRVREVVSEIASGIYYNYWTYNGQVPGPMLRVREGDTVILSLTNDASSLHHHNIDLHAVTGPGGGATLSDVNPGETKTFKWKALNPGLYVYHCAMPNVSTHNSHGQYGMILVEPKGGLPKVDKEFYIVQGELYTVGETGKRGLVPFDSNALVAGEPNYVVFNGRIEDNVPRMKANVGDRVRIYIGNGGVNLISSFHIIGEIFDTVYPEGAMGQGSSVLKNVQTTIVPAGGSSVVEFTVDVPGKYLLVDHALARMNKGAWAVLEVSGKSNPEVFSPVVSEHDSGGSMHMH